MGPAPEDEQARVARILEEELARVDSPAAAEAVIERVERLAAGQTEADRARTLLQADVSDFQMYPGMATPAAYIAGPVFKGGSLIEVQAKQGDADPGDIRARLSQATVCHRHRRRSARTFRGSVRTGTMGVCPR